MSKTKTTKELSPKKKLTQEIESLLTASLTTSLDGALSEKKIRSRIRKAVRVLTEGIKLKSPKLPKSDKKKKSGQNKTQPGDTTSVSTAS